ncbi:amidase [Catalinimonas alkaloidigena]|uniref:amidase n=1 Tax=Catalinimonas alkaloidigena TaxID=1075417 RepID=UPI002404DBD3|nr:amidase [Catalinimonas alkaloidigena]MDF9798000.1 amidase [Catalinimonas alkaloidigena]
MNRRKFLLNSSLGSVSLSGLGLSLSSCQPQAVESELTAQDTDTFAPDFELDEITIAELQKGMEDGTYTAEAITQLYLERIVAIDKNGPSLKAVIELNPEALEIAQRLDEERANGNVRGSLHGIPIMLKDNIDTGDRMQTTAGALAMEGHQAEEDAFIVKQLREAGAIILAKTNLSEWANFRSTRSSSGWSSRGGQTKNPYATNRNPCGSSSGSGVAVSANLCALAIGTETNGSIVCPASTNGIVGIKPTLGLLSRAGIIPIAHTQDTAGPMARTVTDAVVMLGTITAVDEKDSATQTESRKALTDYTPYLNENGLEGKRIGIWRGAMGFHEEVDALMEAAFERMRQQGATLVDVEKVQADEPLGNAGFQVLLYEFKADLNQYLQEHPNAPVKSLEEVIAFNKANEASAMPYFKQEILERAQEKGDLNTEEYKDALAKIKRVNGKEGIDLRMQEHDLDAIIAPTGGPAWPTDLITGDHFLGGSSSPAAQAGYPNITVPAGFVHGLPVGISIFGKAWTEPELISIAYAYEQASKNRKKPKFLTHIV